ncbi:MAG: elongation factor Ts [Clostridiales bacterium]|nr:elongation factor Ts [Clostridiales bacterium]
MANITASAVSELRKATGCGMMDCKKALVEADGDFEAAKKILREKGLSVAAKKQDRIAAEGLVDIMLTDDGKTAAMIEVNSETDFVAKNESFGEFVKGLLRTILSKRPNNVDELMALPFDGSDVSVEDELKDKTFVIGEKLSIRRFVIVEGYLNTYIHGKGTTGVIVKMNANDDAAKSEQFAECSKNIALQIAAMAPAYTAKEDVPEAIINEEKEVLIAQIKADPKNESKPEQIIEKMVTGRIGKFYEKNCLNEQAYVKDDGMSVKQYVESVAKELDAPLSIHSFVLFEKGEGIEKREDNLGDEVAKMLGK